MRTFDDLEAAWRAAGPEPRGRGTVRLVCVRRGGGEHVTPERVRVTPESGVEGDRWSDGGDPDAQVTLMSARVAGLITDGAPLHRAGDNFLVDLDLSVEALPVGSRVRIGTALLEVTAKPHAGCRKFLARFGADALRWVNTPPHRDRRLRGVNCRVIEEGVVALGDEVVVSARVDSR
jgi:MOSC domain-containing protein YiiM